MIRSATAEDAEALLALYAPYVATPVTFEIEVPALATFRERVCAVLTHSVPLPWLVWDDPAEGVLGYAYAAPHRERAGYFPSVETSVYVGRPGQGLGTRLYTELLAQLRTRGLFNAYAGIALPNPASVALHEKLGFQALTVYRAVGFKQRWIDVGWWELDLQGAGWDSARRPSPG